MYPGRLRHKGRTKNILVALLGTFLLVAGFVSAALAAPAAGAATLKQVLVFGSNPGNLRMFTHVPGDAPANMPLVVALHGCSQSASDYDNESGWTKMANTYKFALLLPEQTSANNPMSCFNWFEPSDTRRGSGEALSIKQMVDRARADHSIDADRVYVTGLSGGGFMTPNLLAAYPDVFAGGAIVAGGPARCASDSISAFLCMNPGSNKSPQQWGNLVRGQFPSWAGPWPKVSIWHGGSDSVVNVMNLTESMEQWTNAHGADQKPDVQDTVHGYPHRVYHDTSGEPVVETYRITGQPHGQPLDPGNGPEQCGVAGGTGMPDMDICAAYHIAGFFGLDGDQGGGGGGGAGDSSSFPSGPGDGYVKASADGTGAQVGTGKHIVGPGLGRGLDGLINRGVLSFDTSALPDNAQLTRAYVTVTVRSTVGDPWASPAGNQLTVGVNSGCLGGSCATEADDWAASPTTASAATIAKRTSGQARSSDFSPAGLAAIDESGTTQLKLQFAEFQNSTAYAIIGYGSEATLTVEFETP